MAETVSHISERGSYRQFLDDFRETIENATVRLNQITPEDSGRAAAGEWSPKQTLGHLIDSAVNNHPRFVRAQFHDHLVFSGYEQDNWVNSQRYQEESWAEVIQLWRAYNLHLLHVASVIPEDVLTRARSPHTLDQIAFKPVQKYTPATLEYVIRDYVDHLRHHLDQIFAERKPH
jgi:hypothetical protein